MFYIPLVGRFACKRGSCRRICPSLLFKMAHTALVSLIKIPAIRTCFTCVERSSPFKLTRTHLILHICWGRRFSNRNIVRIFDPAGRRCRSLLGQLRLQLFLFLLDIVFLLLNILDQFAFSLNLRRKTICIDGDGGCS